MSDAAEKIEQEEGAGLDAMLDNYQAEESEKERLENEPSKEEKQAAREMAENMNEGFLWVVQNFQCPHVNVDEFVDRKKGEESFLPLAEKFGGEVPEWIKPLKPYFAAGIYMGMTIKTARKAEALVVEEAKRKYMEQQREQANQGAADGD